MQADRCTGNLENGNFCIQIDNVVYCQCTDGWSIPEETLSGSNLTLITGGAADYVLGGQSYRAEAGSLIYVPHGGKRQATLPEWEMMHCCSVDFSLTAPDGTKVDLPLPFVSRLTDSTALNEIFNRMNVNWNQKAPYYMLKLKGLLQLLISTAITSGGGADCAVSGSDERIRTMMTVISIHYAENLSLEGFADQFGLNKVYLGMLFKKHTGVSFQRYLLNTRLNAAGDLLYTGKYSISDVAYKTGFQDPSYFSRLFNEVYGMRPGKYKKLEKLKEPYDRHL